MTSREDKMTPAEARAYNIGVEEVRSLARSHIERREDYPRRGVLWGGMMAAFRYIIEDGEALLRKTDGAPR